MRALIRTGLDFRPGRPALKLLDRPTAPDALTTMLLRDRDLAPARKRGLTRLQIGLGLLLGALLALGVRSLIHGFFVYPAVLESGDMAPALPPGKTVYVWKQFTAADIKRGAVVLLRRPDQPDRFLYRRIIGLPGEQVQIHERRVFINNRALEDLPDGRFERDIGVANRYPGEPLQNGSLNRDFTLPVILKQNQIFVLADDRVRGLDSRELGPLTTAEIAGLVSYD